MVLALAAAEEGSMKDVLTTTEIARICKVSPRTVIKWFDAGRLRGYRQGAGRGKRVVPREILVSFLHEHGMPLGELEGEGSAAGTPPT
jgi:excisionase family DNA binding protein